MSTSWNSPKMDATDGVVPDMRLMTPSTMDNINDPSDAKSNETKDTNADININLNAPIVPDKMSKRLPNGIPQKWIAPVVPTKDNKGNNNNNAFAPDFEYDEAIRSASFELKRKYAGPIVRWKLAIRVTLDRYVLQMMQTESMGLRWDPTQKTNLFPYSAVNSVILKKMKQEVIVSELVRNYLAIPDTDRTYKHMELVDGLLKKMPAFSKYSKELRLQLYDMCHHEVHTKHSIFIKPSCMETSWYIVLSGFCRIYYITNKRQGPGNNAFGVQEIKLKSGMPIGKNYTSPTQYILPLVLGPGDSFGDFVSIKDNERRSTSTAIQAMSLVHVLRIDKQDFWEAIQNLEARFIDKQQWIASLPGFKDLSRHVVNSICKSGSIKKYNARASIIRSGDPEYNLYFLMNGDATAYQLNAFIKTPSVRSSFFRPKFALIPYNMDKLTPPSGVNMAEITHNQEVVFELVPIGQIPPRGVFPYIFINDFDPEKRASNIHKALQPGDINFHTISVGTGRAENGASTGSWDYDGSSLTSSMGCECFVIPRTQLVELVGDLEKLKAILGEQKTMIPIVDRAVQQGFLSSRGWVMV